MNNRCLSLHGEEELYDWAAKQEKPAIAMEIVVKVSAIIIEKINIGCAVKMGKLRLPSFHVCCLATLHSLIFFSSMSWKFFLEGKGWLSVNRM